ncbi:MAG: putative toxin-antitoxin system toxin component, PIN family [Saprospiraceae bacterium]|nr:putative toxin-antitoxin system toxin component, PIN family [Saprospiraceae bacterium]MCF8249771.1 putative toxin-antitoxin system toxin component, PIN family [Saprospiraceae bacterium]MCF8279256.1 putative toxin-antitoxin system toxin component, PIN family [Bacteroidales bacterium]MCF8312804.1 putative toxin-antitoxin system toxin component, PIN family [Saprospiraceae bacterium]MCF8441251.1 putative toxin-antitoxin system toxin component, PIN family [Saprospiraceae bacterium]
MKIVLDTNSLLVSVSSRSPYYPIYKALRNKEYELVVTTDILLEYEEIIGEEMGALAAEDVLNFMSFASNVQKITAWYLWDLIKNDPDDNKFSDAAIAANADFLVSDDRHFRVLKKIPFPKLVVIRTVDFLKIIAEGEHLNR